MTNPLVATAVDGTSWHAGLGLVEEAASVHAAVTGGGWIDGTLGGVGTSLDSLGLVVDPLGTLVSWGVAWLLEHVRPLSEALDWLAGNPEQVAAHAATWANVGRHVAEARDRYAAAVAAEVGDWQGASAEAYRAQADTHVAVMRGLATAADGVSAAVHGAGLLVALVREIVRDLIAAFVATLAARLPMWLAQEGITLGLATPAVIAQVTALVAQWANRIAHFIRALLTSLRQLQPLIGRLDDIFSELARLQRGISSPGSAASGPTVTRPTGADPTPAGSGQPGDHLPGATFGSGEPPYGSGEPPSAWREGDPIPPPRETNDLPTDAHLRPEFHGENDPDNSNHMFWPRAVTYFSPEEREAHRIFVDGDGNLRRVTGELLDTREGHTLWSGQGRAIFVVDEHGNLYATTEQEFGRIHHSTLLAGQPVAGAGEIEVTDGRLVAMTDKSGHYRPSPEMNDRVLEHLRGQGLQTSADFKKFDWNDVER